MSEIAPSFVYFPNLLMSFSMYVVLFSYFI